LFYINLNLDGNCKYGSVCTFAHGDTEIRTKSDNTLVMSENAVNYDSNFNPNMINPYLMQDPNFMYNMMMQQQMMEMQMQGGMDQKGQMNQYMGNQQMMGVPQDFNLNEMNSQFYMNPNNMNNNINSMNNNMNPNNMNSPDFNNLNNNYMDPMQSNQGLNNKYIGNNNSLPKNN
jgi:hypothetical protein